MTDSSVTHVSPTISSSVERLMRRVEDFPSAGVQFCDLTPVLADPDGFDAVVRGLIAGHEIGTVDYVAGLDARGFLLAGAVAVRLHTGVLAVRGPGKGKGRSGVRAGEATLRGLAPDALVLGKPLGGGMPCAAYGFTAELAARFRDGLGERFALAA